MKIYVKVFDGSWNTLPCHDSKKRISFILSEMKKRLGLSIDVNNMVCKTRIVTGTGEMSQLNNDDLISDVLQDGDFVHIGKFIISM